MTWRRRLAGAALLTGATFAVLAPPALAQPQGTLLEVDASGTTLHLSFSAADGTQPVDLAGVKLAVGFQPFAGGSATPLRAQRSASAQVTVIVALDTSQAMGASAVRTARQAAADYVRRLPPDARVGLVTFGGTAQPVAAPDSTHGSVISALSKVTASGATHLYDGVVMAADAAGSSGVRRILLLAGSENTGSTQSVEKALATVRSAGVVVDPIALPSASPADLTAFAQTSTPVGSLQQVADLSGLPDAFRTEAATLQHVVTLVAPIPPQLAGLAGNLLVQGQVTGGALLKRTQWTFPALGAVTTPSGTTSSAQSTVAAAGDGAATASAGTAASRASADPVARPLITTPMVIVGMAGIFLALAMVSAAALGVFTRTETASDQVLRRLSVYTLTGRQPTRIATQEQTSRLSHNLVARSAVQLVGKVVQRRDFTDSVDLRLEAAGLPIRTAEWLLIHVGIAVGSAVLFLALGGGRVAPMVVGLAIGLVAPWVFLSVRQSRRETAFLAQLPDTLQLLAGGLQAGYSLPQSMDSVVREAKPPISVEFNRALVETRLGMPPEEALEGIAARTHSRDFSWVVMAIRIQREVGGNLAELLRTVAETLRERERLHRQVRSLSAEGRLSAWILGLLPVLFTVYLVLAKPDYIAVLYQTPLGRLLSITAVILLGVGAVWMTRVVKVEV